MTDFRDFESLPYILAGVGQEDETKSSGEGEDEDEDEDEARNTGLQTEPRLDVEESEDVLYRAVSSRKENMDNEGNGRHSRKHVVRISHGQRVPARERQCQDQQRKTEERSMRSRLGRKGREGIRAGWAGTRFMGGQRRQRCQSGKRGQGIKVEK
jgi:hypothetical protein